MDKAIGERSEEEGEGRRRKGKKRERKGEDKKGEEDLTESEPLTPRNDECILERSHINSQG